MKKILLTAAALLPMLAACDDSEQDTHDPAVYNIVELASRDAEGTAFLHYPAPGNIPVTLRANSRSATSLEPGDCLFLGYTVNEPADGAPAGELPITVKSLAAILNAEARAVPPEQLDGWDAEPISLLAIWRAGDKIILRCLLTADPAPRHFGLLVDESTLADEVPTAYIYHRRENPVPNYSSQFYTAFSLAPILRPAEGPRPAIKALRVRVANASNPSLNEFTIPLD